MAGSIAITFPAIVPVFMGQKAFIQGIVQTGVKG